MARGNAESRPVGARLLTDEAFYRRHRRELAAGLFLLGLALRLIYAAQLRNSPYWDHPIIDALAYDERGWAIAQGDWLGSRIFYQDPLYPYFLGIVYSVFGHSPTAAILLQLGLGAALGPLVVLLAERLFDDHAHQQKIAWSSGLLAASASILIYYDGLLIKTSVELFLSTFHLWALMVLGDRLARNEKEPWRCAATALGGVLGLNLLARGTYVLLAPVFAYWLGGRSWRWKGSWTRLGPALFYAIGAMAVVAPVTVRNAWVGNELVLITSQGGQNFWIGNNPLNSTGSYVVGDEIRPNPKYEEDDFRAVAEREIGRKLNAVETSRHFFRKGWDWIRSNPRDWVALWMAKWGLWFAGLEIADNYDFRFMRDRFAPVLHLPISSGYTFGWLGWSMVFLAILSGKRMGFPPLSHPNRWLSLLFLGGYSVSITLFFVFSRYRLPIYPVLMVWAAAFPVWLMVERRRLIGPLRVAWPVGFALAGFLVWRPVLQPGWAHWIYRDDSIELYNIGTIYIQQGELEEGLSYFQQALAENTANEMALNEMGLVYQNLGRYDQAQAIFERMVTHNPKNVNAWHNLGYLHAVQKRQAPAEAAFLKARELRPDLASPSMNLGVLYAAMGRIEESRRAFREYVALMKPSDREFEAGYADAAQVLLESPDPGDFRTGLVALGRIPRTDPANPPWISMLSRWTLPPEKELLLREFLQGELQEKSLGPRSRSRIMARLESTPIPADPQP